MQPVLELLRRVAPSDANVLILGENGTGKGVLARQLHRLSRRHAQPMISVNMGGIAASVFESETATHREAVLPPHRNLPPLFPGQLVHHDSFSRSSHKIGRASCRERVCQYV